MQTSIAGIFRIIVNSDHTIDRILVQNFVCSVRSLIIRVRKTDTVARIFVIGNVIPVNNERRYSITTGQHIYPGVVFYHDPVSGIPIRGGGCVNIRRSRAARHTRTSYGQYHSAKDFGKNSLIHSTMLGKTISH